MNRKQPFLPYGALPAGLVLKPAIDVIWPTVTYLRDRQCHRHTFLTQQSADDFILVESPNTLNKSARSYNFSSGGICCRTLFTTSSWIKLQSHCILSFFLATHNIITPPIMNMWTDIHMFIILYDHRFWLSIVLYAPRRRLLVYIPAVIPGQNVGFLTRFFAALGMTR